MNFKRSRHGQNVTASNSLLYYSITVSTSHTFRYIKNSLLQWLQEQRIYISTTTLLSPKNCCIGWLTNTSPSLSIRNSIQKDLSKRFQTILPFQLTPKTIHSKQKSMFNTRALSIECSVQHAHQLESSIYENYNKSKANYINSPTENMEYIPLAAQEGITNHLLDTLIDKQNNFLSTFRRVPIKNVKHLPKSITLPNSKGYDTLMDLYTWLITQKYTIQKKNSFHILIQVLLITSLSTLMKET